MGNSRKICVGMFAGAHGVRGLALIRSFTQDPETIMDYDRLEDEDGQVFELTIKSAVKDCFIAEMKGVSSREAAAALKGTKLYVGRDVLPKLRKREYYEADLVGLTVKDKADQDHGKILSVHDYGAGPFLEIGASKEKSFMLPFTDACVPEVDIKKGAVVIDLPDGWV
jgi:16S rRNA processing protein RimM